MAYTWLLNPNGTWDVMIGSDGLVAHVTGKQEVAQRIVVALKHFYAEYFLAPLDGVPYLEAIFGSKDSVMTQNIIQANILSVPNVLSIASMQVINPTTANKRTITIAASVEVNGTTGPTIATLVAEVEAEQS